jgi:hypothetical protein
LSQAGTLRRDLVFDCCPKGLSCPAAEENSAGQVAPARHLLDEGAGGATGGTLMRARVSKTELARRLGVDEKEVRRMLDSGARI